MSLRMNRLGAGLESELESELELEHGDEGCVRWKQRPVWLGQEGDCDC